MQRVLDPAQIEGFAQRAIPRIRLPDPANVFSERAARLRKLSEGHAVGDYLRLMAALADAQQEALSRAVVADEVGVRHEERLRLARAHGMPPLQASAWSRDERWHAVLHELCGAIAAVPGYPEGVAKVCRDIQAAPAAKLEAQADLLLGAAAAYGESTDTEAQIEASMAPFIMAALQVYWTGMLASLSHDEVSENIGSVDVPGVCPVCGTQPVASIVRAEKAYQGYRYLHCALCATEWHLVRIKCSHCESTAGIHYHSIEGGSSAIRAEACDHCKTYRKICYQEYDTDIEPVADDLASLAIDLLMTEAGFQRASGHPLLWQA
jgi:FdhE protein